MLKRHSDTKLKIIEISISFKCTLWYKNEIKRENTCVISLVMFYENIIMNPIKVFRVLSCLVDYFMEKYVFIDDLGCQSK